MTFMAIAVESSRHPKTRSNYKIWYLIINKFGEVVGIGTKSREELVQSIFENYRRFGKSHWRAFCEDDEKSRLIELYDFIAQGLYQNTHFGNLPTLSTFQETLNQLQLKLEVRAIAC
jgi:hypothetical protein